MGALKMGIGALIFLIAMIVMMQPIIAILDGTQSIRDTASTTMMYGTDSNGSVVPVGYANSAGDLTDLLLYGIGIFACIGFIIWLVMRAPLEPDWGSPEPNTKRRF